MSRALYEAKPVLCLVLGVVTIATGPGLATIPGLMLVCVGLLIARMRYVYRCDVRKRRG